MGDMIQFELDQMEGELQLANNEILKLKKERYESRSMHNESMNNFDAMEKLLDQAKKKLEDKNKGYDILYDDWVKVGEKMLTAKNLVISQGRVIEAAKLMDHEEGCSALAIAHDGYCDCKQKEFREIIALSGL